MLIRPLSDLHLESSHYPYRYLGETVLLLLGDLGEGMRGVNYIMDDVLPKVPEYVKIIYVMGNHEYYGQDIPVLNAKVRNAFKNMQQVEVLMNRTIVHDGVAYFGTTLSTNFDLYSFESGERCKLMVRRSINDFTWVQRKGRTVTPEMYVAYYRAAINYLQKSVIQHKNVARKILCTHYCAEWSVSPRFRNHPITPFFATPLPQNLYYEFDYWFHGHTHSSMNYEVGDMRVICNPRGYGFENVGGFNDELLIEV